VKRADDRRQCSRKVFICSSSIGLNLFKYDCSVHRRPITPRSRYWPIKNYSVSLKKSWILITFTVAKTRTLRHQTTQTDNFGWYYTFCRPYHSNMHLSEGAKQKNLCEDRFKLSDNGEMQPMDALHYWEVWLENMERAVGILSSWKCSGAHYMPGGRRHRPTHIKIMVKPWDCYV